MNFRQILFKVADVFGKVKRLGNIGVRLIRLDNDKTVNNVS